ncbi:hypothetical protein ANCDUO_26014 [Ancylostoma duodenale]|uniref:Uncharacterized protein n=1 Tax=Ancylostoma duodenale TaxID=51022 RepID=A0A0C2BJN0_9BILA|nr:hypothetical protein ANCDUO_26014 [Ancylostoma duodenale]
MANWHLAVVTGQIFLPIPKCKQKFNNPAHWPDLWTRISTAVEAPLAPGNVRMGRPCDGRKSEYSNSRTIQFEFDYWASMNRISILTSVDIKLRTG